MDIIKFVTSNWDEILVVIALIAVLFISVSEWIKKFGPIFNQMSTAEKLKYIVQLISNLVPIALALVTDAEIQFGDGTGPIKRSWVIGQLYQRIPDEFKKYITEEDLSEVVEDALLQAKILWENNEAVARYVYLEEPLLEAYEDDPFLEEEVKI